MLKNPSRLFTKSISVGSDALKTDSQKNFVSKKFGKNIFRKGHIKKISKDLHCRIYLFYFNTFTRLNCICRIFLKNLTNFLAYESQSIFQGIVVSYAIFRPVAFIGWIVKCVFGGIIYYNLMHFLNFPQDVSQHLYQLLKQD